MKFIGDLHIHSHFSRATAKNLDFENLYIAAQHKGITVVGTGDFTHPGWFAEIKEKLEPAEEGLFKLRDDLAARCDKNVPMSCRGTVRFILSVEISNIYKKNGKTRKNHNIIFMPDLTSAEKFNEKLDKIGNIHSDGRPILGLDAKHLFETALSVTDRSFLIPAHIWTPWFSLLGSKSGFDSLEACFEDLTPYIFAVETGLSSDPPMNRRVSDLDGLTLVSNSDAHSPSKLGREANLFDTDLSYSGIREAISTGDPAQFLGTIEFYPEEGKYHLDGHRKCQIRLWPHETTNLNGVCPVCGKPVTLGVLNRVETLADRENGHPSLERNQVYLSRTPLVDVLSEILQVGPNTKKVQSAYHTILNQLGSELKVLNDIDMETIDKVGIPLLSEGIHRMRTGQMVLEGGYDGEFGVIKLFSVNERQKLLGQQSLFIMPEKQPTPPVTVEKQSIPKTVRKKTVKKDIDDSSDRNDHPLSLMAELNEAQSQAVYHELTPLLIVAGPGTGKTRTLIQRIAYLIKERKISPHTILAVTFTNKAAREMLDRLSFMLGNDAELPFVSTFHGLCLRLIMENDQTKHLTVIDDTDQKKLIEYVYNKETSNESSNDISLKEISKAIFDAKQSLLSPLEFYKIDKSPHKISSKIYQKYQNYLEIQFLIDYEDLIAKVALTLENNPSFRKECQERFCHLFVDEYQDVNYGQYRIVRLLSPEDKNLCVIGDPDQSIYSFRGSDHQYFTRFLEDYPTAQAITLRQNYRSTQTILDASYQVISDHQIQLPGQTGNGRIFSEISGQKKIHILELETEKGEAHAVARSIERLVGGSGYDGIDQGRVSDTDMQEPISFSDVAVLYRTDQQHHVVADAFFKQGIPFQVASREKKDEIPELRQLLSLFKTIEGVGHYGDFERIIKVWHPRLAKDTIQRFCQWGLYNQFNLKTAQHHAGRIPIPGMRRQHQEKLVDLFKILSGFEKQMKSLSVAEKIQFLITHTRFNKRQNENPNVSNAFRSLTERAMAQGAQGDRPIEFISSDALENDVDTVSFKAEKVTLMTMHASKGLEFPIIFVIGCEDGFIPFYKEEQPNLDEERRLFYVAMTRAKRELFLSWARRRYRFGEELSRDPSPFMSDIEKTLLLLQTPQKEKKLKKHQTQLKLF